MTANRRKVRFEHFEENWSQLADEPGSDPQRQFGHRHGDAPHPGWEHFGEQDEDDGADRDGAEEDIEQKER